jgi:hypothetical protein
VTTKVLIVCPDNSVHDVLVQVVKDEVVMDTMLVPQHGQSEPVYLDGKTRLLVSEQARKAEPKAS